MKKEYALKNFENEFDCQTKEYCQAFNKADLSK